jgi:UDP-glucose 4-epimerase
MPEITGKTFFVTGGAGFIGSNMVASLIEKGASVIVYDNLSSGRYEFIKHFEGNAKFDFIKGDLLDVAALEASMKNKEIDAVIHFAANSDIRRGTNETDLDLKQGVLATYNVLESMHKNNIKDILFSSSSVVYGIADRKPTPEDYGPLLPVSLYGASKLGSEGLISAFAGIYGIRYFIYRFANIVGRNETHGVIVDLIKKVQKDPKTLEVLGNGEQKKSYVDVADCVEAMLHVYKNSKTDRNLYNIASDEQTSVKEIAEMVIAATAKKTKIHYTGTTVGWAGDVVDSYLDNTKLKGAGFSLKKNSKEAVANAIKEILRLKHS